MLSICYGTVTLGHKRVFYWNGWTDTAGFWYTGFPQLILYHVIRKFDYLQNNGNFLWNYVPNSEEKFWNGMSTIASVVNLVWVPDDHCRFITLRVHVCVQHGGYDTACCVGSYATADTCFWCWREPMQWFTFMFSILLIILRQWQCTEGKCRSISTSWQWLWPFTSVKTGLCKIWTTLISHSDFPCLLFLSYKYFWDSWTYRQIDATYTVFR